MRTTERECLDALQEAAEHLGKSPTKAEYEELGLRPSSTTVVRIFESWNHAKEKANLETFTQSENGGIDVQPKPDGVSLPDSCDWESLTPQQRWYYKNRKHRIAVKERRREQLKRWFYRVKRDELECRQCGESRPPALDLHHRDEKEFDVSKMVNDGYSRERIREEMARCDVLCANCHRKVHYDGPDPSMIRDPSQIAEHTTDASKRDARKLRRRWLVAYRRNSGGCNDCSVTFPACLDFHHDGEKRMRVGLMVSFGYSIPEIRDEIDKCTLLCANCHRVRHFDPPDSPG